MVTHKKIVPPIQFCFVYPPPPPPPLSSDKLLVLYILAKKVSHVTNRKLDMRIGVLIAFCGKISGPNINWLAYKNNGINPKK